MRAQSASIELLPSLEGLCSRSDYILSIVPPDAAVTMAKRVISVFNGPPTPDREHPLYYLDLNATSPSTARVLDGIFAGSSRPIRFIDGGVSGYISTSSGVSLPDQPKIIGPPPKDDVLPSIVLSGPHRLASAPMNGAHLADALNTEFIASSIGSASGLKMCFASLTKGLTALAIQSFTTASKLGVMEELQSHLERYSPKTGELAQRGLLGMGPKAYRWVGEMEEIAETMQDIGGFERRVFEGIAEVYRTVAEETDLGETKPGTTVGEVANRVSAGLAKEKTKSE